MNNIFMQLRKLCNHPQLVMEPNGSFCKGFEACARLWPADPFAAAPKVRNSFESSGSGARPPRRDRGPRGRTEGRAGGHSVPLRARQRGVPRSPLARHMPSLAGPDWHAAVWHPRLRALHEIPRAHTRA